MALNAIQRSLERLYEIDAPCHVEDFLVTDRDVAEELEPGDGARDTEEKLLVHEADDGLEISLFLCPDVVERLHQDPPAVRLHRGNLQDYCTALEGVSHFLYLTWNASHRRSVSLLELEIQAEVDKFVSSALLFGHQSSGSVPARLVGWLFDEVAFDGQLEGHDLERYRHANHYAGKYCARLQRRFLRGGAPGLLNEVRRFYRLGQGAKIQRIEAGSTHR